MNSISDTYRSIAAPSKGIYKELGSKFLAFAYPVETEEAAKNILAAVRKEYFDARHHCFAWRLGLTGEPYLLSDDGEPSSTAGRPIHGPTGPLRKMRWPTPQLSKRLPVSISSSPSTTCG